MHIICLIQLLYIYYFISNFFTVFHIIEWNIKYYIILYYIKILHNIFFNCFI